jgi:hypothetical protein
MGSSNCGAESSSVKQFAHIVETDSRSNQSPAVLRHDLENSVLGVALDMARQCHGNDAVNRRLDDIQAGAQDFSHDPDAARQLAVRTVASPYMQQAAKLMAAQLRTDGYKELADLVPKLSIDEKR